ncbi:hypothetical protein L596_002177 [Steinernema carpocapsae]|uniref:Uncharacterized protein n=1 Tax=Steinernema carpocapsae TaxID=34508 RepID=A0A4U8UPH8_STECR|nr:hypothetical protein L596_002177 [Steinernema carpocapsae]
MDITATVSMVITATVFRIKVLGRQSSRHLNADFGLRSLLRPILSSTRNSTNVFFPIMIYRVMKMSLVLASLFWLC